MVTEFWFHILLAKITGLWPHTPVNMFAPGKSTEEDVG
jgi:hypothetical protein